MLVFKVLQEFSYKGLNKEVNMLIAFPLKVVGLQFVMVSKINQFNYLAQKMEHIRFNQHVSIPFLKDRSVVIPWLGVQR